MARNLFKGIKPLIAFVLGGPGSGKGTQCKMICDEFGFKHLSAGDLLRAERNSPGSKYGQLIEHHIREGTIVPVEVTCSLLEKAMMEDETGKFLIDGFPRNQDNLQGWQKQLGDKVNVIFVIFLDCPQDVCVERCLGRGQGRSDDNEVSLRKRLVTYENDTVPIINHYRDLNLLKRVDATKTPSEVYSELRKCFTNLEL